ncbi:MAG: aldehyde dehydrogenase family protein [Verrucomicrobiota bacterium]|nr:aldehyde dehydrogenase family protein [Verrucomicrobiota bacterium]
MNSHPESVFINGKFHASPGGVVMELVNPATEKKFLEIRGASVSTAIEAIEGAHRAFEGGWRDLSPGKRTEILFNVAAKIREKKELLAALETENIGKPIADARDEIGLGAKIFEYYAGAVTRFFGQTIPVSKGGLDIALRQPMGVVTAIVPWNFPFPIACWKVAPALAAGNCVVLKPASLSPVTALMLGQLAVEAGLPPGVLQVVAGSGSELGDALVTHPLIRKISFTGSTEIGSRIMALAAPGLKRISLELGGKSPNIIFADANVMEAAQTSPMSVFANAGQDCCARSRVFVERAAYKKFVEAFVEATKLLRVGDPESDETQVGPLVSAKHRQTVEHFVQGARKGSGKVACGGDRPYLNGAYLSPMVVLEPSVEEPVWKEEVFGPVVCIRPFDTEEEMLREVNSSPYGLSGSIWTNDVKRALRVSRAVESGVLSVNSHSSVHVEAPFGGFKMSGIGRDLGMQALEGYSELKNIYFGT